LENETTLTKNYLSRREAAEYLGIHINTIDQHSELPRIHFGRRTLFRKSTLDKFFEDLEQAGIDLNKRGPKCRI